MSQHNNPIYVYSNTSHTVFNGIYFHVIVNRIDAPQNSYACLHRKLTHRSTVFLRLWVGTH